MTLTQTLDNYSKSNMYPFHMPGHKRMLEGPYKIDMTEVDGVDDLHDPTDVIANEQKRLAKIYKAKESFILVGGSTVGNLSAIYGCCDEGDLVLIQRNSHRSVYNGAILRHLKVGYIHNRCDENGIYKAVTLDEIKKSIEEQNGEIPKAIVITSPTYEGFAANIEEISDFCHGKNITLIVDSAHGAHLGFHKDLPSQCADKADVTIMSLHKTLPCLTQTAVLHISGDRVDSRRIREALDIFETSSPSYVLMNSVSQCINYLEENTHCFDEYVDNLNWFYDTCGKLKHISIYKKANQIRDIGKIVISTKNTDITGIKLSNILRRKYEIETELSSFSYVLAMTSIMDTKEGFERLASALTEIDDDLKSGNMVVPIMGQASEIEIEMEPWEAKAKGGKQVELKKAKNMICQDSICLYPPGAPVIVPGEKITDETIALIEKAMEVGIHVTGINNGFICVVN